MSSSSASIASLTNCSALSMVACFVLNRILMWWLHPEPADRASDLGLPIERREALQLPSPAEGGPSPVAVSVDESPAGMDPGQGLVWEASAACLCGVEGWGWKQGLSFTLGAPVSSGMHHHLPPSCPFPHWGWELDPGDESDLPQHLLPLPWGSSLEVGEAASCCCCILCCCSELHAPSTGGMLWSLQGMEHNCSSETVRTQGSRTKSYPQNQTVRYNWYLLTVYWYLLTV